MKRVPVAHDMAGPPEVAKNWMLQVGDEQIARALLDRRIRGVDELEVVEALEVEPQHAARAVISETRRRSCSRC